MPISEGLEAVIAARTRDALASGALEPVETDETALDDGDVRFVVRSVSSLARKRVAGALPKDGARPNPFSPPDAELVVGELTPTHFGVLNKYPVVPRHLLIVTREFVDQETLLDAADFAALAVCLREVDGLGFYNGGRRPGRASRTGTSSSSRCRSRRARGGCRWRRCSTSGRAVAARRACCAWRSATRLPCSRARSSKRPTRVNGCSSTTR
jgi:hypothetical protein